METIDPGSICWECKAKWSDHREVFYKGQMVMECPEETFDLALKVVILLVALFTLYLGISIIWVTLESLF